MKDDERRAGQVVQIDGRLGPFGGALPEFLRGIRRHGDDERLARNRQIRKRHGVTRRQRRNHETGIDTAGHEFVYLNVAGGFRELQTHAWITRIEFAQ